MSALTSRVSNAASPRVTIGVPVYNGERYLAGALDSLLAQTYGDFELIISDNCSTDGTAAIAHLYVERDARVRYERQPRNMGVAANYERLAMVARGEFFRWASVDDLSAPEALECCVEALDKNAGAVLAYPRALFIDENGMPREDFADYEDRLQLVSPKPSERFSECFKHLRMCNPLYALMRTDALRKTRGLGSYVGSDIVLLAELALYGMFHEVPRQLFFRRVHPEALSSKSLATQNEDFNPGEPRAAPMREWRHLWELWRAVQRAPIGMGERASATALLLRRARWNRDVLGKELWRRTRARITSLSSLPRRRKVVEP